MRKVRKITSEFLFFLLFLFHPWISYGLGLGNLKLQSHLNEPLQAQILLPTKDKVNIDEIIVTSVDKDNYKKLGLTPPTWLNAIQFKVIKNTNGFIIQLTTKFPIKDPYADLVIEVISPSGKLVKEYTVLFDPPKESQNQEIKSFSSKSNNIGVKKRIENVEKLSTSSSSNNKKVQPGEDYGPIFEETLWSVAKKLIENTNYSIYQGVASIAKKNPQAFKHGNIHFMREGVILHLPSLEEIDNFSRSEAQSFVENQNQQWQKGDFSNVTSSIKLEKVGDRENIASVQSTVGQRLKLIAPSQPNESLNNPSVGTAVSQRLSLIEEAIDTLKRTNEDISQKNQQLQSQNESLLSLLTVKENEITQLREIIKKNKLVEKRYKDLEKENYALAIPDQEDSHKEKTLSIPHLIESNKSNNNISIPKNSQQPQILHQENSVKQQSNRKNTESSPDTLRTVTTPPSDSGGKITGFLIVLAMTLGLLLLVWKKREILKEKLLRVSFKETDTDQKEEVLKKERLFDLEKSLSAVRAQEKRYIKSSTSLNESKNKSESKSKDINELLEEAEIYITYERYDQAEKIFKNILAVQPQEWRVLLKLLELYVKTEKYIEFEKEFVAIPSEIKKDFPQIWSQIELLHEKVESEKSIKLSDEELITSTPIHGEEKNKFDLDKKYALTLTELEPTRTPFPVSSEFENEEPKNDPNKLTLEKIKSSPKVPPVKHQKMSLEPTVSLSPQISLAKAYIEMGDLQAAKTILTPMLSGPEAKEVQLLLAEIEMESK